MTQTVKIEGAERLQASMHAAGAELRHMDTANQRVAMALAQRSRAAAPKRSGALARSVTGAAGPNNSADIGATVVYAGVIHNGWPRHHISANPFIMNTVKATQATWLQTYATETQQIVNNVKGA